jgi:hypothetical protein
VVAKVEFPIKKELAGLFQEIDRRYKEKIKPTEREILEEIQAYRMDRKRASKKGA